MREGNPPVPVVLVLAAAENGVIGRDAALPWDLPDDLRHFKTVTYGRPVVMGRRTFDSVGRPLPGRTNIVLTRDRSWSHPGVRVVDSIESALALGRAQALIDGADSVMVVGGAEVYRLALPFAARVLLTRVHGCVDGDTHFDLALLDSWREASREFVAAGERNSHDFSIVELVPGP